MQDFFEFFICLLKLSQMENKIQNCSLSSNFYEVNHIQNCKIIFQCDPLFCESPFNSEAVK